MVSTEEFIQLGDVIGRPRRREHAGLRRRTRSRDRLRSSLNWTSRLSEARRRGTPLIDGTAMSRAILVEYARLSRFALDAWLYCISEALSPMRSPENRQRAA